MSLSDIIAQLVPDVISALLETASKVTRGRRITS